MTGSTLIPPPSARKLKIFAFDPSVSSRTDFAEIGEITVPVQWEDGLQPGPVGEYVEVVDADPASGVFYRPVDLNDQRILAQQGLPPSETNPQFHQQMAYTVAMATIEHFEQALGRVALWSSRRVGRDENFVRRLRIYPHALRERNAYYSPDKKALLFGYFPVDTKDAHNTPGTLVFTCLSHDIVAHETTHALLDGVHPRFGEPVNVDVLAFHEAFADVVALFQHFGYPGVLRDQIARSRGRLDGETLLSQLAQQFGLASGRGHALRDALGHRNQKTDRWERVKPDVHLLERTQEPHARGAILVAAVFGAFLTVYRKRTRDLYSIATEGTGVLRDGDIHPDLANRLAEEAARAARQILQMCIRAIDYCPPVGITFGDYLRGIITADHEINAGDPQGYQLAFIESFRSWGIHPPGMRSMSIESLLWPNLQAVSDEQGITIDRGDLEALFTTKQAFDSLEQPTRPQSRRGRSGSLKPWTLDTDRYATWLGAEHNAEVLWNWLMRPQCRDLRRVLGIVTDEDGPPATVYRSRETGRVAVEVHSVRTALRRTARGGTVTDLVVEIAQRRRGYFDSDEQERKDTGPPLDAKEKGDFTYRAGCTLLMSPATRDIRRVIRTPGTIVDPTALERQRTYLRDGGLEPTSAFAPAAAAIRSREPFALLHRHGEH